MKHLFLLFITFCLVATSCSKEEHECPKNALSLADACFINYNSDSTEVRTLYFAREDMNFAYSADFKQDESKNLFISEINYTNPFPFIYFKGYNYPEVGIKHFVIHDSNTLRAVLENDECIYFTRFHNIPE